MVVAGCAGHRRSHRACSLGGCHSWYGSGWWMMSAKGLIRACFLAILGLVGIALYLAYAIGQGFSGG